VLSRRQVAIVAPEKVGARLTAIVEITLDVQAADRMEEFERVAAAEAVMQCYRVAPGPDFVLVVQVVDMPAYHALAHRLFTTHSQCAERENLFFYLPQQVRHAHRI
jgi:Lrp/AsnC family leucine-responsive transcriptional regulator